MVIAIRRLTTVKKILNLTRCFEKWVIFLENIATVGTKTTISNIKNSGPWNRSLIPCRERVAK